MQDARKKLQSVVSSSPYRQNNTIMTARNEFLFRDKEVENKSTTSEYSNNVQKYNGQDLSIDNVEDIEQNRIVGIAEPKGFWTKFIMSQKIGYIMARMTMQQNGQGFWTNIIKAQSMSQGRDQSRGR